MASPSVARAGNPFLKAPTPLCLHTCPQHIPVKDCYLYDTTNFLFFIANYKNIPTNLHLIKILFSFAIISYKNPETMKTGKYTYITSNGTQGYIIYHTAISNTLYSGNTIAA